MRVFSPAFGVDSEIRYEEEGDLLSFLRRYTHAEADKSTQMQRASLSAPVPPVSLVEREEKPSRGSSSSKAVAEEPGGIVSSSLVLFFFGTLFFFLCVWSADLFVCFLFECMLAVDVVTCTQSRDLFVYGFVFYSPMCPHLQAGILILGGRGCACHVLLGRM